MFEEKIDIEPINEKGNKHGYCEIYWDDFLWISGIFVDDKKYGYIKDYDDDAFLDEKDSGYYLNNVKISSKNEEGWCYVWNRVVV